MSHVRVICRRPILLAGVVLVSMLAMAGVARASGFGEIRRFGAPGTEPGKLTAARLAPGLGNTLEWEPWHVIGVDSAEHNTVFVLEEYKESKSTKHAKKEWSIRYLRLQEFSETGTLLGDRELTVETPSTGNGNPVETEKIEGIAVDAKEGRLYFLVTEELEKGVPGEEEAAAAYLYAFNTAPSGKKLEPVAEASSEGVLATPKELGAESKEPGQALLSPSGIAVDPKTHEVLIAAHIDTETKAECEEELGGEPEEEECEPDNLGSPADQYVIQHVKEDGKLGEPTLDTSNVLKAQEAESNFFPPASPVVAGPEASERVLTQHLFEPKRGTKERLIAEFPDGVSGSVAQFALPLSEGYESGFEEILEFPGRGTSESDIGGTLAVSPEGTTVYGVTRLGEHEVHGGRLGVTERTAAKLEPIGWTGGEPAETASKDACAISPGAWEGEHIQIAAGADGDIFVLVPEYLHKAELEGTEFATHEAIIELGPGGTGCPQASVEKNVVIVNDRETTAPVGTGVPVTLSSTIKQGDALSVVWKIENEATKEAAVKETPDEYQTPKLTYTFTTPGSYKISEEIKTDNLDTPTLTASRTLVVEEKNEPPTVTTQPHSVTVEAGTTAEFTAAAAGKPTPTPRWQVKTPGGGWSEDSEDTGVKGLTLKVVASEAKNGNEYRAVFTNSSGSKETEPATLTVTAAKEEPTPTTTTTPPPTTTTSPPPPPTTTAPNGKVLAVVVEAPRATIAGAATLTVSKSGAVSLSVSCPPKATTCIGTVTLRTATAVGSKGKKKSIVTLAGGSFSIAGGQTKTIALHLSGTAKGLLAKMHELHAKATVAAHDPAEEKETTTKLLTLRPAPAKKHK